MSVTIRSTSADRLFDRPKSRSTLWGRDVNYVPSITLFNIKCENVSLGSAADNLVNAALRKQRTTAFFVNAHTVNTSESDPSYTRVLNRADVRYADGSGIAIAAKIAGTRFLDNVNGTDLLPMLTAEAAEHGLSIYLFGGSPGTAEKAVDTLLARYPRLKIAGCDHGYYRADSRDESEAIARINDSGADILLVGLGVPLQEKWLSINRDRLNATVRIGVGGLFDYFAGSVSRAPLLFRRFGMEWLWRVMKEPIRLGRRYFVGNVMFLRYAMRRRIWGHQSDSTGNKHRIRYVLRKFHSCSRWRTNVARRLLDLGLALPALVMTSPIMIAIAIAIRLESPGGVMFRQTRIGARGKPFTIYKFRSMVSGAENMHVDLQGEVADDREIRFKSTNDQRVTLVGRILRKTSLDELPQLINVVKGDMSIVGPRPALPSEVRYYNLAQRERLLVKPGITCTWQISGRADLDFVEQVALDRQYARQRTVFNDIAIMLKTVPAIINARGAY